MTRLVLALALIGMPALAEQPQMPDLVEVFFKQFDQNQDGQVSQAEFLAPSEQQFAHMDRDKNGSLDQAEVQAFDEEIKQRMQEMRQRMQQQGDSGG